VAAGGGSSASKIGLGLGGLCSILLRTAFFAVRELIPTEGWMEVSLAELPPSLTPLGGSELDTVSGLARREARCRGRRAAGTVPSPALRLGRETAPGREGQADTSVRSDLNLCSQCWLQGVVLCAPQNQSACSHRRWPRPGRDHTLAAALGRQEGGL